MYLTRCSTQTSPLPGGQHVAKKSLDVMLKEKHSLQSFPWGGGAKPLVAHGLLVGEPR